MTYLVQHKDLQSFFDCPVKYRNTTTPEEPQTISILKKCVTRVFLKEFETGRFPTIGGLNSYWGKQIDILHKSGMKLFEVNNITISLHNFYEDLKRVSEKLKTVALWLPLDLMTNDVIYRNIIPAVLADKDKNLIPVFFNDDKLRGAKDNNARFGSSLLKDRLKLNVDQYLRIKISVFPANISLERFTFNTGELDRASVQLDNALSLISSGYTVPNTNFCHKCSYSTKCRL